MRQARNDLDGALRYIIDAENIHPNRNDMCIKPDSNRPFDMNMGGFSGPSQSNPGPSFLNSGADGEAPSVKANNTIPFNMNLGGFGGPSQPSSTQPSLGGGPPGIRKNNTIPFTMNQGGFGGPSQPTAPASAKPNNVIPFTMNAGGFSGLARQAPAQNNNPFANGGASGSFGQPSGPAPSGGLFGQPSNLGPSVPKFGQPSQPGPTNPFARGLAAAQPAASWGGSNQAANGGFGQTPQSQGGLFAQGQQTRPLFGQPSGPQGLPFGQLPQQSAPASTVIFGVASQPSQPSGNAFQPSGPPAANPDTMQVMDVQSESNPYPPNTKFVHPNVQEYSYRDGSGKLQAWKSRPVQYINDEPFYKRDEDQEWERIWFPDGPPRYTDETELPEEMYDDKTKEAYLYMREHGVFKDGWMPFLPPRREWCLWDF